MNLQLVSSNCTLTAASKYKSHSNSYRNVRAFGEVTLCVESSNDPICLSPQTDTVENLQNPLGEILFRAGLISRCDMVNAAMAGRSKQARDNFARIADKYKQGVLTLDQAAVAVSHIHHTGAPLTQALALVCKYRPDRV